MTPVEALADRDVSADTDPSRDPERVVRALDGLSARHQAVLSLHYLEGLAIDEVALVLGCRIGTVKSGLSRARAALRKRLALITPAGVRVESSATKNEGEERR